ncbi:uridine kinase [Balneicella halophila]|uniref:Uridine kinase n=1 Tax=Balneicella halophila TaxID=1537566 RepID=A0A7L4UR42_BALHA|nr:uridine kinase [Balneicella halophila]PVX52245.1 uridine kinase [Balneicella halophila]
MIVLGIAGGTGSGKTTVTGAILEKVNAHTSLLEQDAYYRDMPELSLDERAKVNYDHPDAIEFSLLIQHIKTLKKGLPIAQPIYDFTNHLRKKETTTVKPARILIVEGILIFAIPELRELFDMKIFVDTDDDERLLRRISRDMEERGRSFESVQEQYRKTVKPMHLEFVEPSKRYADVIIPRGGGNNVGIDMVASRLQYLLTL